jgi:hypothetical protein
MKCPGTVSKLRHGRRAVLAMAAVAALPLSAAAAVKTWSNSAGGTWSSAANWANGVPGASDTALFNLGLSFGYTVAP